MNNYFDNIQPKLEKWLKKIVKDIAEEKCASIDSVKESLVNVENIIHKFTSHDEFNDWVNTYKLENKSFMEESNFRRIVWREYLGAKNIIIDVDVTLFSPLKSEEEKREFKSLKPRLSNNIDFDSKNKISFMLCEWEEEIFCEKLHKFNINYQQGKLLIKYNHRKLN